MRYLYILAVYLAAPLISLVMLWRGLADRSYWSNFSERFGFGERLPPGGIWIHAVSVGEVQAAAALVTTLRQRYPGIPVLVTTLTPTGAARAKALFQDNRTGPLRALRSARCRCGVFSIECSRVWR